MIGILIALSLTPLEIDYAQTNFNKRNKVVTVRNRTGMTIVNLYANNIANSNYWQEDILGDATLKPNASIKINFDDGTGACMTDIQVIFSNKSSKSISDVDVCSVKDIIIK